MILILLCKELGKFNLKISVTPNRSEKYPSFAINNNFQFLSSSLDSVVKKFKQRWF